MAGFAKISNTFETTTRQLRELQNFEISPKESYEIIGKLFFEKKAINITQLSQIKREFEMSEHFRHLGDIHFTAYDLYNDITEALKTSHPSNYFDSHIVTHSLFEEVFHV